MPTSQFLHMVKFLYAGEEVDIEDFFELSWFRNNDENTDIKYSPI